MRMPMSMSMNFAFLIHGKSFQRKTTGTKVVEYSNILPKSLCVFLRKAINTALNGCQLGKNFPQKFLIAVGEQNC